MQVVGKIRLVVSLVFLFSCSIVFAQQEKNMNYFDRIVHDKKYQVLLQNNELLPSQKHQKPIFCRLEDYMENQSGMAIRFRLGTLDYVNYLEYNIPYYH